MNPDRVLADLRGLADLTGGPDGARRVCWTAEWVRAHRVRSIRLVTADWHMRRAALELGEVLPEDETVLRDAVRTQPSLWILFLEYHKLIATWFVRALPG